MRPSNPAQVHASFIAVVQRAFARPLADCTGMPARPSERVHGETGRVVPAEKGD